MQHIPAHAATRLTHYKTKYPSYWRDMVRFRRGYTRYGKNPEYMHRADDGELRWDWSTGLSTYHLGYADELAPRRVEHNGWYSDEDGGGTVRGLVLRIPTAKGTIYAPGYYSSDCDGHHANLTKGEYLLVPKGSSEDDHEQARRDVACWADSMAENAAEECRNYDSVYRAERDVEDALTEVGEARNQACAVVDALREAQQALMGDTPKLCVMLRTNLTTARAALHDALDALHKAREAEADVRRWTGITERTY